MNKKYNLFLALAFCVLFVACTNDNNTYDSEGNKTEYSQETYAGGKNGTTFNFTSRAYKQAMPFIDANPEYYKAFMCGKQMFGKSFVSDENMNYSGLGPVYIRKSCIACHLSYGGRSQRVNEFDTSNSRNGYLLMIYDPNAPVLPLASTYFTGMTQTRAVSPYKARIDEKGVKI